MLCYSNGTDKNVTMSSLYYCPVTVALFASIGRPALELRGLALDAKRGLLYYTDSAQGIIAEITTSGSNRREIYRDRNKRPRAIVVDPNNR